MIISASRRTDIPAYYSDWFIERIKDGFVYVRNPMNFHMVSKIRLTPDVVDCIVFWTKNPKALISRLDELQEYHYYFQFTLTSYGEDVEPSVPSKSKYIIPTFKELSDKIGPEKVIWRYDPIITSKKYTCGYNIENFKKMAKQLSGYTEKCTISFLDFYKNTEGNLRDLNIENTTIQIKHNLAKNFSQIAQEYNFKIDTCAEDIDFSEYNISKASCIDIDLIERITGKKLTARKDRHQRKDCGCVESVDIGSYNTCNHGCKYCYANSNQHLLHTNIQTHNSESPLIFGEINPEIDKTIEKKVKSLAIDTSCVQQKLEF